MNQREIRPVFYTQEQGIHAVTRLCDQITHPSNMSAQEAKDFFDTLQMEIEGRIEGLKDDIKSNEEEIQGEPV